MNPLPPVPNVARLSKRVIRILGQNGPSKFVLQGTNTYIIGTGTERILLDTAEGLEGYSTLLRGVLQEENCSISTILLSHWHHDHVDGLSSVLQVLEEQTPQRQKPLIRKFPHESDEKITQALKDQEEIAVEGATLRAIHTPGHTNDHLSFLLAEDNVLFTGDHILGGSSTVFEDLGQYMASLEVCQGLSAQKLYPGHGLEMDDAPRVIREYIEHRQLRENQILKVLQAVRSRPFSAMEIVQVMYKDVREDLHLAAEHGVKLHLKKLLDEGRIAKTTDAKWKCLADSSL